MGELNCILAKTIKGYGMGKSGESMNTTHQKKKLDEKNREIYDRQKFKKESNENQSVFFNKLCNFFLHRDITDYTSGFICVKRKVFENYKLKGNYGDYFVNFVVYCKLNNYSIIELPFRENERYSGSSKTSMKNPFYYIYLTIHYFVSLKKNFYISVCLFHLVPLDKSS